MCPSVSEGEPHLVTVGERRQWLHSSGLTSTASEEGGDQGDGVRERM